MDNNNEGDASASTEVESSIGVLDQNSLAQMISASKVQKSTEQEAISEETETQAEESEETEETEATLSQDPQDQDNEEADESDDSDEDEEGESEEGENVLSKRDRAINKLRNRNKKLTKNWRTAEEEIESLKQEVQSLKATTSDLEQEQPQGFAQKVKKANSVQELISIKETAELVSEKADDLLFEMSENGDSEIEYNGRVFTRAELRDTKKEADETLKKHIPSQAQLFEQRQQFDEVAMESFDFLSDTESEEYKFAQQIMADPSFGAFLGSRSEQLYVLGLLAEGKRSLDARSKQKQLSKEKGKTEETHKAASTPKIAPSIPGITGIKGSVAPARASGDQIAQNKRKEILSRNRLDATGLAQLIRASKK
jgi:hypothetical protein